MTSTISWLNGFSALALVCSAFIFTCYFVYIYQKTKNSLYLSGAIIGLAVAFGWMGITLSFLSVVIYGYNLPGLKLYVNILSYSTLPIGAISVLSIGWELLMPAKHKKKVLFAAGIFAIVYYIILIMTFNRAVICPPVPEGEIYDDWLSDEELPYYLVYALVLGNTIIFTIGIIRFLKGVTGELRKRVICLIIASPIFGTVITLDTVIITTGMFQNFLFIVRFSMILALILIYNGFKPSEEEIMDFIKEDRLDDEQISAIERIFASRPEKITEEEIKYYREQTICLVCKSQLIRFTLNYICYECRALYCAKCARALSKLENACWACNSPIDESKPVKPFKKEEEIDIEISEKPQKKPKKKSKKHYH